MWLWLLACTPPPSCACDAVEVPAGADVQGVLDAIRPTLFPDLDGVSIAVQTLEVTFFQTTVALATFEDPPRDRRYLVQVDPAVLADPPSQAAMVAVLAHELGHAQDFVGMSSNELADFAIWYANEDVADYEHATDEKALTRGCAAGLAEFREWVYSHTDGDVEAEKRRLYYDPAAIAAWAEANTCDAP